MHLDPNEACCLICATMVTVVVVLVVVNFASVA